MTVKIAQENGKAVVSVDGNEALKADAAGNVEVVDRLGVGIANPTTKLDVAGGAKFASDGGGDFPARLTISGDDVNPMISADGIRSLILGTNETDRLRITSNGNVGIGTPNPAAKLDVIGEGRFVIFGSSEFPAALEINGDGSDPVLNAANTRDLVLSTNQTERMRISGDNGNVSIANDLEVNGTTIAALIARIEALEAGN